MGDHFITATEVRGSINLLRGRLEILETKAASLGKRYFDFVMAENKVQSWGCKSVLYAQARMRDNTLSVIWYEVHWYGSKAAKTRRMTKKIIRKPKDKHGYNLEALLKLAQELPRICEWLEQAVHAHQERAQRELARKLRRFKLVANNATGETENQIVRDASGAVGQADPHQVAA